MSGRETADQARTRRRWITLAEVVALAGVLIAALTLWSNWADRRADEAEKTAATQSEQREKARVELSGTVEKGRRVVLKDERHDITDVIVTLPRALGVAEQRPVEPVIKADWIAAPLLKLTDGGEDDRTGRLPVLVTVSYVDGDTSRTARGLYDVIWRTRGRGLLARGFDIEGFRLRQHGGDAAALERAWQKAKPQDS